MERRRPRVKDPFSFTAEEQAALYDFLERLDAAEAKRSRLHKWVRQYVQTERMDSWRTHKWWLRLDIGRLEFVLDPISKERWHSGRGPLPEGHWYKEVAYNRVLRIRWMYPDVYKEQWGKPYVHIGWSFMAGLGVFQVKANW
jgi:hypothetical protein